MGQRGASHSVTLAYMHSLQILVALLFCVGPACALRSSSVRKATSMMSSASASSSPCAAAASGFITAVPGASLTSRTGTRADVRWISERLARMTASQWSDAFKAAGCTEMETQRYVVRLRQKVDEGLALEGGSAK